MDGQLQETADITTKMEFIMVSFLWPGPLPPPKLFKGTLTNGSRNKFGIFTTNTNQ